MLEVGKRTLPVNECEESLNWFGGDIKRGENLPLFIDESIPVIIIEIQGGDKCGRHLNFSFMNVTKIVGHQFVALGDGFRILSFVARHIIIRIPAEEIHG